MQARNLVTKRKRKIWRKEKKNQSTESLFFGFFFLLWEGAQAFYELVQAMLEESLMAL